MREWEKAALIVADHGVGGRIAGGQAASRVEEHPAPGVESDRAPQHLGGFPAEDVVVHPGAGQPPQRVAGRAVQGVGSHDNQARAGMGRTEIPHRGG